jgi:hypothetical protein
MPLPLIIIVVALCAAGAATAVALKWDAIMVALKGKRLAVFGARGVGKTHLIKFLTSGSIPEDYKQTVAPEKATGRRFQLRDLDLRVKDTLDLSGDKSAYAEWKELHDQADVVFYLLRADRLIVGDEDVETRVRDDLRHIGGWLDARASRPRFFIIGTHCDFDPPFTALSSNTIGDYVDKFRKLPIMIELVARSGGAQQTRVVLGSMKTIKDTEALVYQVFTQIVS